jgi:magnesium/cobalt transport protein CorA
MSLRSQAVFFDLETREVREIRLEDLKVDQGRPSSIYWIHLDPRDSDLVLKTVSELKLTGDLVAELMRPESLSDLDVREDRLTLAVHYWEPSPAGEAMEARRLALHLTEKYCLTIASEPIPALDRFAAACRSEFRFAQTTGFILFLVLENLVEDFAKLLHRIDGEAEAIDDQIHGGFFEGMNRRILGLKKQIITLKHQVTACRDILMKLSGRKIRVVSESCRVSLGDVYHHAEMVVSQLESQRELVASFLDAYNAALAQKMNDTMKVLTIFSAVILPLSLVAGIYGMNFRFMPELDWRYGYGTVLGLMGAMAASLIFYFKRKGWL